MSLNKPALYKQDGTRRGPLPDKALQGCYSLDVIQQFAVALCWAQHRNDHR